PDSLNFLLAAADERRQRVAEFLAVRAIPALEQRREREVLWQADAVALAAQEMEELLEGENGVHALVAGARQQHRIGLRLGARARKRQRRAAAVCWGLDT